MNQIIADNRVSTLRAYLTDKLSSCYDSREANNLVHELFKAFHDWSRTDLVLNNQRRLGESELLKYHFALKRLLQGEPLQYVLGHAWFFDMKLHVTNHVLIPRPETEELVRLVVSRNVLSNPRILEIGTGSGCIALALKKLIPGAFITSIDVSSDALSVAKRNAAELQLDVDFKLTDFLTWQPENTFDILVSNPPYIPWGEKASMSARVTEHEPHLALFTPDEDALIFYKRMMELSAQIVDPGGLIFCEIHENMANSLLQLANNYPITTPAIHLDLQGKNRMMSWNI